MSVSTGGRFSSGVGAGAGASVVGGVSSAQVGVVSLRFT